ncbi:MAG: NUDIX hydrolase [Microgenomates group bacterium Gr01-1014_5]|nr:MAG: NUDIX hydrolase [Microgenomates group bacterium Gr01-1014_5]
MDLHQISVTAIIFKDDKFLITKRAAHKKVHPNRWTVPGGKVTVDDYKNLPQTVPSAWYYPFENALSREVKEEVALEIKNIQFLIDMTLSAGDIPMLVLSYYAEYVSGDVKHDEDTVDSAWVTVEEAKKYDLIEGIYEEIVMVDKILKGADSSSVKFEPRKY